MIFSILILIFLGAIVFFHYIQGFFGATISAILTVVAAIFAFSYHESVVPFFGGRMADYSTGLSLLALFGLIYILPRMAFDAAIPGNVRLPLMVDRIGAVVMGLIAGIFATGIMAVAAAEMPFGPDIAGFTRFDSDPKRQVKVETQGKAYFSESWDELSTDKPGEFGDDAHGVPIVPVDNILIGLVSKLSGETGSLQNNKPLETDHPDFLTEAFGQRLGIEPSATHVAVNLPGGKAEQVKVLKLFAVDSRIPQQDSDTDIRKGGFLKPLRPGSGKVFVAVRVMFSPQAADADTYVRFSTGSVRLMLHNPDASLEDQYKDYYPIGTMEGTDRLFLDKLDDFLICKAGNGADFVFSVPKNLVDPQVKDGSFVEVKRGARVDLSGMKVISPLTVDADIAVMRKTLVMHPDLNGGTPLPPAAPAGSPAPAPTAPRNPTSGAAATPSSSAGNAAATGSKVDTFTASNAIPVNISLPPGADANALLQVPGGGTAKLENARIKNINMDASSLELKAGNKMSEFAVPAAHVMVQVSMVPTGAPAVAWGFLTDPEQYELVDSGGKHYQPNGIVALYRGVTGERVRIRYIDSQTISGAAAPDGADAPTQVNILYNVPVNTTVTEFDDHGQKAKTGNLVAK